MKLFSLLVALFLTLNIFISPILAQENPAGEAAENVDVNSLFWPVVPGKTVKDPLFFLKQLKEGLMEIFTFGDVKKALFNIEISEKRLVEANKLIDDKDYSDAFKSLELNKKARDSALKLKKKAVEEKQDAYELSKKLTGSLEKQQKALTSISNRLPGDQKAKIQESINELVLQISEAK